MAISFRDELRRKAIHLSSLWMVVVILLFPDLPLFLLFGFLAVSSLLVEHAYANGNVFIRKVYDVFFHGMLRREVRRGQWIISGGPPVLIAALAVTLLFPTLAAAGALTLMLIGDTAAALIGRRFGKHRMPNGKSVEGVLAFIVFGFAAVALLLWLTNAGGVFYAWAAIGVFPAAAAEFFAEKLKLDDNFTISMCMGMALSVPYITGGGLV